MRTIVRLVFAMILIVGVGALILGYWAGSSGRAGVPDRPTGTSGQFETDRAREIGAEAGARIGEAGARAKAGLDEAGITARIKAKMALDDFVKARAIDVTTSGSTVTLTGSVGSAEERVRAERLARETDGVTQVVNRLTIGP